MHLLGVLLIKNHENRYIPFKGKRLTQTCSCVACTIMIFVVQVVVSHLLLFCFKAVSLCRDT